MKKQIITLISLSLISISVVFVLYFFGTNKNLNHQYNSFERSFVTTPFHQTDTLRIPFSSYYLAGTTTNHIYLGNTTAPAHLLVANTALTDTTHVRINVRDSLPHRAIKVAVDSPYVFLTDGTAPFIYKTTLHDRQQAMRYIDDIFFTTIVPISHSSFALVAMNNMDNTLEKKTAGISTPEIFNDILQKQGEGIFSTDGMLHYDKELARLIYVYSYRNEYICMDTNFNLLQRGHTIDTITQAKIKVEKESSNGEETYTLVQPSLVVNKKSAVSGNLLYIHSNLLAKNESVKSFEQQSVIDVYSLTDNAYIASFYIPPYNKQKAKFFSVIDNRILVALYDYYLVCFTLNTSSFSGTRACAAPDIRTEKRRAYRLLDLYSS